MVPLARIGLATPSLPMTCSTTELQRHNNKIKLHNQSHHARGNIPKHFIKIKQKFYSFSIFFISLSKPYAKSGNYCQNHQLRCGFQL